MKIIIPKNKIDKKYYAAVWFALMFASALKALPQIYYGYLGVVFSTPAEVLLNVFLDFMNYALFPTFMCYIVSLFLCSMLWRRGIVMCSRNDFIYYGMIFTGASRLLIGFINIFAIIEPVTFTYTSAFFDTVFLTLAIYIMGIVLMRDYYKQSFKKIHMAYQTISPIYFIFLGLETLIPAISNLIVYCNPNVAQNVTQMMEVYLGMSVTVDKNMFVAAILAIIIYVVVVCVNFGVGAILKKQADKEPDDDMGIIYDEPNDHHDDPSPFEEFRGNDKEENVFDEFDL